MSIYVNDSDLGALVYHLSVLDGHLAPAVLPGEPLPLADSAAVWSTRVTVAPREITVGCDVRPVSLADRQTILDRLTRRLAGDLELRTADLPTRVLRGRLAGVTVELYPGGFAVPACWVTLRFTCPDPARSDVEPLVYGLSTTRTACPIGTQSSAPTIWIYGACTNPSVVVRAASGAEVSRLALTVTLGTNDALMIDATQQTITRTVAGVVQTGTASGLAALSSGRFPLLAPEDATADGTAWPTVALEASSGTPTGLILYNRRW